MSYALEVYPNAREQIAALPPTGTQRLAEVFAMLELTPWTGDPLKKEKPDGAIRTVSFGQGFVTYLVLERIRRVDILEVIWIG